MSKQAADTSGPYAPAIPALAQGSVQELSVDSGLDWAFIEFGSTPTAGTAGQRIRIPAGSVEYFKVTGGEKVAAKAGSTSGTSSAFASDTSVVRVTYDAGDGVVEVMECA